MSIKQRNKLYEEMKEELLEKIKGKGLFWESSKGQYQLQFSLFGNIKFGYYYLFEEEQAVEASTYMRNYANELKKKKKEEKKGKLSEAEKKEIQKQVLTEYRRRYINKEEAL